MASNAVLIEIEKIRRDGGTQSRVRLDESTVAEYTAAMEAGATFPPVVVFYDGTAYWLADGFHRIQAWANRGVDAIQAEILQGTQRDAVLHSVGVNATHGLRRTNEDKRRAVEVMLRDPEWREWSDRKIAERAGVDHKTVGRVRGELFASGEIPQAISRLSARSERTLLMTEPSYAVTPQDNAEVEAARQFAIGIVEQYASADDLKAALKSRTGGSTPDGIEWKLGVGYLSDGPESSQSVTAKQIGVAMTTPNGTGVFRFDAFNLWQWVQERSVLLKDPTIFSTLLTVVDRRGNTYLDPKIAKNLVKYGLAASTGSNYVTATAVTRRIVEEGLQSHPLLKMLYEARRGVDIHGDTTDGQDVLVDLYRTQASDKRWVVGKVFWRYTAHKWLSLAVDLGLILVETRPGSNPERDEGSTSFYAVTDHLCMLMGKEPLPLPDPLPDLPYNHRADMFVPPDAEFKFKVGDHVMWDERHGHGGFRVTELVPEHWPFVALSNSSGSWTPSVSQFELTLAAEAGTPEAQAIAVVNEHAALDDATADIWEVLLDLEIDFSRYPDQELAQQLHISLQTMKTLIAQSESGQRLELVAVEDDEDGALSGGGSEDIGDESEDGE